LQVFLHGHEADVVGTAFLPGGRRLVFGEHGRSRAFLR
jgi:hypothetical protein